MAEFDVDRFIQLSGAVQVDDLDYQEAARAGVTDAETRILRYMGDTESHTILYMRDLLAGYTARDPEVTAFLSVWVYEELWHGRAIDMILAKSGRPQPKELYTAVTLGASLRELLEASLSQGAAYLTPKFVATHMAWGAINELTAAAAYTSLARHTANKPMATLLRRLAKQERKHYAFYYQQAEKRLTDDKWAQRLCKLALKKFWTPVGSGVGHMHNLRFVAAHLFNEPEDWQTLVDAEQTIQALPGMAWFNLLTTQVRVLIKEYHAEFGKADERWSQRPTQPVASAVA